MDTPGDLDSPPISDFQQPPMGLESMEAEGVLPISASKTNDDLPEEPSKPIIKNEPIKYKFHIPDELWEIILNQLTDDDRTNCCRAFPIFDEILTKSKPVWMFKQILPLIQNIRWDDRKHVLASRLVCKQWRSDIDKYLASNPYCIYTDSSNDGWFFDGREYHFDSVKKIQRFNQIWGDAHSDNPFLSKIVGIENSRNEREFPPRILDLLSIYGEHIFTLEFNFINSFIHFAPGGRGREAPGLFDYYDFFQQVLKKTPNLRKLIILGNYRRTDVPGDLLNYRRIIRDRLRWNTLPANPRLETLEIQHLIKSDFLSDLIIAGLVSVYASHLQNIDLPRRTRSVLSNRREFPKLARLTIKNVFNDEDLKKLLVLTSPLEKLQIGKSLWESSQDESFISISTLLEVLQNFPLLEKLKTFNCFVEAPVELSHLSNYTLKCFKLNYWTESDNPTPTSFNFLRVFKALEDLTVEFWTPVVTFLGKDEGEGELQFYKMLGAHQPYESNIWRLLPSLTRVQINYEGGCVIGTRNEFEVEQAIGH